MYDIYELEDGTFECHGRVQDGTEKWNESTIQEAVKSLKQFAETVNRRKIKKADIKFYRPKKVTVVEWNRVDKW